MESKLEVKLTDKLILKNPVVGSSGCWGYGDKLKNYISNLGAIVTKSITYRREVGAPQPRLAEGYASLLNCIGLENIGLKNFLRYKLPKLSYLKKSSTALIVSIAGYTEEEYIKLTEVLSEYNEIAAIEVNISCPNTKEDKVILFGQDKSMAYNLIKKIREKTDKILIVKLTPNVENIVSIAESVIAAGCNVLSLINTVYGMLVDINTKKPKLSRVVGGISGPAIKPIALRNLYEIKKVVKNFPIICGGGIMTWQDAIEFIITGANAISVGTAALINPETPLAIIKGIKEYLYKNNINKIEELINTLNNN